SRTLGEAARDKVEGVSMRTLILTAALTGSLAIPAVAISDPAPPPGQLQTTDQTTKSTVQDAAAAPMHDLNVVRAKIPPVLLAARNASPPHPGRYAGERRAAPARVPDPLSRLPSGEVAPEGAEPAFADGCAQRGHQGLEKGQVVPGEQDAAEDFLRLHKVVQI